MQTTKAHAKWLKGGDYPMWEVSHPNPGVKTRADRPHDAAAYLLKEFVLHGQVAKRLDLESVVRVTASCNESDIGALREAFREPLILGIDYATTADRSACFMLDPLSNRDECETFTR